MTVKVKVIASSKSLDAAGHYQKDAAGNETVFNNQTDLVERHWMAIRGCRITGRTTNITFGQIVNEPLNFSGLLVTPVKFSTGEDSFEADNSVKDA
jgi:hypothetical protein